jgi:hypothetical protein
MRRRPKWSIDFQHWRDGKKLTSVMIAFKATHESALLEAELVIAAFDIGMVHARQVQPALEDLPDGERKVVFIEVVRGKRKARFSIVCERDDAWTQPATISKALCDWLVSDPVQEVLA